ncbi:hypothetical protein Tsubulata_000221 [Turnera subulata]|uniref:SET domain-containing protein n=1 Tax=Turnera subulata TaxID=218843 RepID=A0A9Q0FYY0_9ROSI|nr:hypothetical protein Tsubulata_000221 [Turnera subulata]
MSSVVVAGSGSETQTLVTIQDIPGRGRGLVATKPLKAGQILLKDSPILLYSAFPLTKQQQQPTPIYCDKCFKKLLLHSSSAISSCPSCSHHFFCSPTCLSAASASSHTPWVCQSLARLRHSPAFASPESSSSELQVQARFLVSAYNLAFVSPPDFQVLLSLQGGVRPQDASASQLLHPLLSSLCPPPPVEGFPFTPELTAALLAKDGMNAFGLMEPFDPKRGGERSVRAYGVYPKAALFNHDCLPNACRFDYIDAAVSGGDNTDITVRLIHDVPQGREICLSYFAVNLNYATRQKRLLEDYGFRCECDRCKVEANWSDNEGDEENEEMEEEEEEQQQEEVEDEPMEAGSQDDKDDDDDDDDATFPHAYFFLRYMCNIDNCGGTLAPLPPSGDTPSTLLECNVCGNIKSDEFDGYGGQAGASMEN